MNQAGYTLGEMLVALIVIGLMMAGMTEGVSLIAHLQGATGAVLRTQNTARRAQDSLSRLLDGQGPWLATSPDAFKGTGRELSFPCAGSFRCDASLQLAGTSNQLLIADATGRTSRLDLPGPGDLAFVYGDLYGSGPVWPPSINSSNAPARNVLRWIALVHQAGKPSLSLATVRLWPELERDCEFDAVSLTCRRTSG